MKDIHVKLKERERKNIDHDFVYGIHKGIDIIVEDLLRASSEGGGGTSSAVYNTYSRNYRLPDDSYLFFSYKYTESDYLTLVIGLRGCDSLWTPDNPFYIRIINYLQERDMVVQDVETRPDIILPHAKIK